MSPVVVQSVLNFLCSNVSGFLCSVILSPFTNNDGAEIEFPFASSTHIQLHVMFPLKILKILNSMCKKCTNQKHANVSIIIIMFIKAC